LVKKSCKIGTNEIFFYTEGYSNALKMKRDGLDISGLGHGQMMGFCGHGNENSSFKNGHVIS
jgi:hypothetical protein